MSESDHNELEATEEELEETAADEQATPEPAAQEPAAEEATEEPTAEEATEEPAPEPSAQEDPDAPVETPTDEGEPQPPVPEGPPKKWYVVHTYSGYENKARKTLEERIKREGLDEHFGQILVPTEEVVEMKRGKRRTSKRKFFPGYMLVQMNMTEATWYLVKSTPKITGFVGDSTNPPAVTDEEVARITHQIGEGAERVTPKVVFEKGDPVRVMDGPFANFNGVVEEVDPEKGKLRVLVSIFGRATPVEMDFVQVEKT